MDPFYAFIAFVVIVGLEILASSSWMAGYFRVGIPLYGRRGPLPGSVDATASAQALELDFSGRPEHPSVLFKAIAPNQIALREKMLEQRAGIRYLPVIHSLIRLHPERGTLTVTGYLNWYVLFGLAYAAYRTIQDSTFTPVALLILGVLILSFFTQAGLNNRIAAALESDTAAGKHPGKA